MEEVRQLLQVAHMELPTVGMHLEDKAPEVQADPLEEGELCKEVLIQRVLHMEHLHQGAEEMEGLEVGKETEDLLLVGHIVVLGEQDYQEQIAVDREEVEQ